MGCGLGGGKSIKSVKVGGVLRLYRRLNAQILVKSGEKVSKSC